MTDGPSTSRPQFFTVFLSVACLGLIALVLVLARQNRELKAAVSEAMARAQHAGSREAAVSIIGKHFSAITGVDAAGVDVPLALDSKGRRLIMLGSAHCETCESVRPFWQEVGRWSTSAKIETVFLLTDEKPKPEDAQTMGVPTYGVRNFNGSSLAQVPLVPALLLLRDGTVEHAWLGNPETADPKARDEILAALSAG